jgi:D-alanine--poly(phosphoribitol) ligase subunit 1
VQTAQRLLILFPNARVLNTYGPTEATVATTIVNITPDVIKKYPSFLPVGYCKKASQLVIKNESDNPGEAGDIVIVGDNVSIGYLKRPELNEKSFFTYNKRRAYNTGDQGYIKDDMLFFLGRNDDQVKLHGYRIELDEISTQLKYHPLIDEVATIPLKKGTEVVRIISYVLLKDKTTKSTKEELIEFLSHKLPIYMLPSDIRFINELPYNNNFKIDRKKLAEMYITGK